MSTGTRAPTLAMPDVGTQREKEMHPNAIEQFARERIDGMVAEAANDGLHRAAMKRHKRGVTIGATLRIKAFRLVDWLRLIRRPRVANDRPRV